jgi:hypothetical protein
MATPKVNGETRERKSDGVHLLEDLQKEVRRVRKTGIRKL